MRTTCRISGKPLVPVFDIGNLYVSAFYPAIDPKAPRSPLQLGIGQDSALMQLAHSVEPDSLYRQYWYRSGTNTTMTAQLKDVVNVVRPWTRLRDGDVVLDIGCNDGTLLAHYGDTPKLFKVGIDPAQNLEELGRQQCAAHATDYFTKEVFLRLSGGRKASVITSIAMFYDLDDPGAFVQDIHDSLADDGIWIVQLSYTPLMLKQNAFDNIIHEHVGFYSLSSLDYLLKKHGLKIVDVELNDVNAGSFRVVAAKTANALSNSARFTIDLGDVRRDSLLQYEATLALDDPDTYRQFMTRVDAQKHALLELLQRLKREGKRVYGYGASSKGNTLLQYYGITSEYVTAIAERQSQKWGLLTPGSWIPIISEEEMRAAKPDYLLVLPWHFIHEFIYREQAFLKGGGHFIVPLPEVRVIGA
ncbi:MAG: class I SAM-dependent methyltransferase [Gemmatimonadaceae bacterium]|nr:class I SAM-dependent methyltransferase [Gemmatimonadaceae bacterium]